MAKHLVMGIDAIGEEMLVQVEILKGGREAAHIMLLVKRPALLLSGTFLFLEIVEIIDRSTSPFREKFSPTLTA